MCCPRAQPDIILPIRGMISVETTIEQLCLVCGVCCNGVLFKDVELPLGDAADRLVQLGLPLRRYRRHCCLPQPCAALDPSNRCRVYGNRPDRCRKFECALFQAVQAGNVEVAAALRVIRATALRAEKVRRIFNALGDRDEGIAFSLRFRRMQRRMEAGGWDDDTIEAYAQLTLAVHDLNLVLRQNIYPDP
jgi:uncharacterized protein